MLSLYDYNCICFYHMPRVVYNKHGKHNGIPNGSFMIKSFSLDMLCVRQCK
jgi:hypothetical protein